MKRPSFSTISNIAQILALICSPFILFIIDREFLSREITPYISVKDTLYLLITSLLALTLFIKLFFSKIRELIAIRPFYSDVQHNYFFDEDGTVVTRSSYTFVNGWLRKLGKLPKENLVWFAQLDERPVFYRLYYRGSYLDRTLTAEEPEIIPSGNKKGETFWNGNLK